MSVFIIAEAGSSHDVNLFKALRLVEAAKECGADAVKFQWTSNPEAMAARRGNPDWAAGYKKYLAYPFSWLNDIKRRCDQLQIEFMCTVYLIEDIATIAPLVKRFKVSAFESEWRDFFDAHGQYGKEVIASHKYYTAIRCEGISNVRMLYCVSKYPTALEDLHLERLKEYRPGSGFSDHTANVLTGAAAVAAGARIVEAHIRLDDTSPGNPDYGHSLIADLCFENSDYSLQFKDYVSNIRTVERML